MCLFDNTFLCMSFSWYNFSYPIFKCMAEPSKKKPVKGIYLSAGKNEISLKLIGIVLNARGWMVLDINAWFHRMVGNSSHLTQIVFLDIIWYLRLILQKKNNYGKSMEKHFRSLCRTTNVVGIDFGIQYQFKTLREYSFEINISDSWWI